jgi:hypothetical protein
LAFQVALFVPDMLAAESVGLLLRQKAQLR